MSIPFHALASARLALAPAAAFERDARARHYPAMVKAGELAAEAAEQDWQQWVAIADWCAGKGLAPWTDLAAMAAAAEAALARRDEALAACPEGHAKREGLQARRDAVAKLHTLLAAHRDSCASITAALREEARARSADAA